MFGLQGGVKKMKKTKGIGNFILFTIFIITGFCLGMGLQAGHYDKNFYPDILTVENIHQDEDAIIFMNGEKYAYVYYGIDDWKVGDVAAAIMYNNKTDKLSDDEITKINKSKFTKSDLCAG